MRPKSFSKLSTLGILIAMGGIAFAASTDLNVTLKSSSESKAMGTVKFVTLPSGEIELLGDLSGLTPGEHGMHVHAVGDCSDVSDGFKKSAGHFNPDAKNHGSLMADGSHAGDLGNIKADSTGKAHFDIKTKKFNLVKEDKHSILGRALVVHAGQDDEKTNPAGNSGNRILCGIIE